MSDDSCPHCGGVLRFLEKDTSSGRDWREYECLNCRKLVTLGGGTALWQVLHDAASEPAAGKASSKRWWRFWVK